MVQLPASDGSFVPEPPTITCFYAEKPCSPEASPSSDHPHRPGQMIMEKLLKDTYSSHSEFSMNVFFCSSEELSVS